MHVPQKLLTANDVGDILGISAKTVRKLVSQGKIECIRVSPKRLRFSWEQVNEYIEQQTIPRRDEKPKLKKKENHRRGGGIDVSGESARVSIKEIKELCQ